MSICDDKYLEIKQETMDCNQMKPEEVPPGLNMLTSEDPHKILRDVLTDANVQRTTESGKL